LVRSLIASLLSCEFQSYVNLCESFLISRGLLRHAVVMVAVLEALNPDIFGFVDGGGLALIVFDRFDDLPLGGLS